MPVKLYIWISTWFVGSNGYIVAHRKVSSSELLFFDYLEYINKLSSLGYHDVTLVNSVISYYGEVSEDELLNLDVTRLVKDAVNG